MPFFFIQKEKDKIGYNNKGKNVCEVNKKSKYFPVNILTRLHTCFLEIQIAPQSISVLTSLEISRDNALLSDVGYISNIYSLF